MSKEAKKIILQGALLIIATVSFKILEITSFVDFKNPLFFVLRIVVFAIIYLILGLDLLVESFENIIHGEIFNETFLMVIASIGAFAIGEYFEGVAVILLFSLGEVFEDIAVGNSRDKIQSLAKERANVAHLLKEDQTILDVSPSDVSIGEIILVKPGEKIPLDGIIVFGQGDINVSSLTGESAPISVSETDEVFAGSISENGLLRIKTTRLFSESSEQKIIDLVENSSQRKSKTEKFITKFAAVYTPVVVICAVIIAVVPGIITGNWAEWVRRALSFLVISCPCALVISIPLAYFTGIGKCSKCGVLVKGSDYLEKLADLDTLVLDKTGTITTGKFEVKGIYPGDNVTTSELLSSAYLVESSSNHPIAKAICNYAEKTIGDIPRDVSNISELPGLGIFCQSKGETIHAGNINLMKKLQIEPTELNLDGTIIYVAVGGKFLGAINVGDVIKPTVPSAILSLRKLGTKRFVMLSGDRKEACENVASKVGLTEIHSELKPSDKLDFLEKIIGETKGNTGYVGDGINDAPSLALSDIGISMGEIGQDAAIESSDVVIMGDDLTKIAESVKIAKKTSVISKQNIILALGVKFAILVLAGFGITSLWLAVFADVGVLILAVLNSMRVMK